VKVLLSAFHCSPGYGSEFGNGWQWAKSLADCGHDVTVLTLSQFVETLKETGRSDINFEYIDLPGTPLGFLPVVPVFHQYRRWQTAAFQRATELRATYDVVHHVTWGSLHLGSRLWQLPAPLVYGPIGGGQVAPRNYWRYFGRNWPVEAMRTTLTGRPLLLNEWSRQTVRHSAVTLVTNSATESACRRLGATDIRYFLAEGLPPEWLSGPRQRPTGVPVILWVGRLLPRKAPTLAVEAFAELLKHTPARLAIVGDGPLREKVRNTVESLGLASHVDLLGHVPWAEIPHLYDSATVFLFCSLRDSSGAQFLESLGRGLPAVTIDHHGMSDLNVGLAAEKVALPSHPDELPRRIATALQTVISGDDWEKRSAAGTEWAANHTWPEKAAAATKIYNQVA